MANQVALRVFTRPGDDVIVSRESHAVWHETGGGGANAGVQFTIRLTPDAADAPTVVERARERNVLVFAFSPRTIRAVNHLDLSTEQCERAADILGDNFIGAYLQGSFAVGDFDEHNDNESKRFMAEQGCA